MNLNDSRNTDAVKALFTSTSSAIAERHHSLDRQISYNRVCVCVYLQIIARTSSEFLSEIERQSIQLLDPGLSSSEELIREVAVEHDLSDPICVSDINISDSSAMVGTLEPRGALPWHARASTTEWGSRLDR